MSIGMTTIAGSLPHELLQPILRHVLGDDFDACGSPDWLPTPYKHSLSQQTDFPRDPAYRPLLFHRSPLLPPSLVNRHWSDAANTILFESISVNGTGQADALYRVLSTSPMHTSLVWCLDFGGYRIPVGEPNMCAEIIKACSQLQHLHLGPQSQHPLHEIRMALSKCVHLRRLCLYPSCDKPYFSMSELLELMTHWPHLENLYLYWSPISPPSWLKERNYLLPSRVSKVLSFGILPIRVYYDNSSQTSEVLDAMLSSKNSLRHLHLQYLCLKSEFQAEFDRAKNADMPPSFYNALPTLTRLRFLKLTDTFFPPNLLTKVLPPSLEMLVIFLFPEDYRALASALENCGWLPRLRSLTVQAPSPPRHPIRYYSHEKETERVARQCEIRKCEWHLIVLGYIYGT
ncbi:hypothetical protein JAAARDRAFT_199243 [Jaapia argillacea MUCL 33604]|uniref:F-box domain-containing protein n=1 Tax=Jaapia argillacea MUCL 33604 TaxID=933084 RepID=A0A067P8G9_9AGAM|nr:hypothetical protein JAAARDRAFT_199243 [Jaapia argillacea MUCL 33604]